MTRAAGPGKFTEIRKRVIRDDALHRADGQTRPGQRAAPSASTITRWGSSARRTASATASAVGAKLFNNVLLTANLATATDALALGRDLGVDPAALASAVAHGSGASFALNRVTAVGGTLDRIVGHAGPLLRKDVRLPADVVGTEATPGTSSSRWPTPHWP